MRFINSKMHGVMDYMFGILLVASPWLFGFADVMAAKWVAIAMGVLPMIYSLLTRYELGVWRIIPLRVHLGMDFVAGSLLIVSPWFFGFAELVSTPFVVLGLIEILVPLFTHRHADVPGEDYIADTHGDYVPAFSNHSHHH